MTLTLNDLVIFEYVFFKKYSNLAIIIKVFINLDSVSDSYILT